MSSNTPVIEIEAICKKIFRESVLDVFYLIMTEKDISKTEIAQRFHAIEGNETKTQKYRHKINEALAKLEGAMFIDSWVDGTANRYFLTQHGEVAKGILAQMFEADPLILKGTKIVSKFMEEEV